MSSRPACYIGLPQWNHPDWNDGPLAGDSNRHPLGRYARYFSSVEGNTTFYGLPKPEAVSRWISETPDDFRFCFKLPKTITHEASLRHCDDELGKTYAALEPLGARLGMLSIQLPDSFTPQHLDILQAFIQQLSQAHSYSIELRNLGFFQKDDHEKRLNAMLLEQGINRTTFDTRPLFRHPADDPATQEALSAKPNMPVHVLATGQQPMVRFITALDWQSSLHYLEPWLKKTCQWLSEGRSPYFFLHTPDNTQSPAVAAYFAEQLRCRLQEQNISASVCFTDWPDQTQQQSDLF